MIPLYKLLYIALFIVVLGSVGCAGLGGSGAPMTIKSNENIRPGTALWRHGNFCGKGHPDVSRNISRDQRINVLLRQLSIDNIDLACKFHDICYEIADGPDVGCDMLLQLNIEIIKIDREPGYGKLSFECFSVITEVSNLFEGKRVSSDNLGAQGFLVLMSPFIFISKVMMGGLGLLDKATQAVFPDPRLASGCSTSNKPKLIAPISRSEFERTKQCMRNFDKLFNDPTYREKKANMQKQFRQAYGPKWEDESKRRLGCIDMPIRSF